MGATAEAGKASAHAQNMMDSSDRNLKEILMKVIKMNGSAKR